MAIQINGNTVIDNSQNITNITDITASGTVNGGIVATTAEAQAASVDNVIMTPLKVKEAIQGGTISVIKSVQRFTLTYNGSSSYFYLGQSTNMNVSSYPAGATLEAPGVPGDYTFINLPTAVNINKSFLTVTVSGSLVVYMPSITNTYEHVTIGARLYSSSGNYAGNQVQIIASTGDNVLYTRDEVQVYVEVVEFY